MASKMLFFILTVLKVNIVLTAAFLLNVHEIMTTEEISETFGTDDGSVPDYQVISMILPGTRRRTQADDAIHLKVEINDTEINLMFKPTAGYLASRYTPVWSATTDPAAYNNIRYDPRLNAMKDIGAFKMYHDVNNKAAIVIYADPDHESIIEGIVTSDYVIKSVPKRLIHQALKVGDNHFFKMIASPLHHKRSIEPDADETIGYVVLFKSPPLAENTKRNVNRHVEKRQILYRQVERSIPQAVYPEILLVLDHNAIRNHTITQALRSILALWNGVDMVYAALDDPKVYLNIAGIIISADDAATPYIAEDTLIKIKPYSMSILHGFAGYFAKELNRFPLRQYDMIVAMTPIKLCLEQADNCTILTGFTSFTGACTSEREVNLWQQISGVGVVNYNSMFNGVHAVVHESAHLLGAYHDIDRHISAECSYKEGFAMGSNIQFRHQNLKWSPCSEIYFRSYFSSTRSKCLDNSPMSINPVHELLPGKWLNLDGQCQNSGYEKSCQIPDLPVCMVKGCKVQNSNRCEITEFLPLNGTKCGEHKHCELGMGCVND